MNVIRDAHGKIGTYVSVLLFGVYSIRSHGRHLALFEPVVPQQMLKAA